MNDMKSDEFWDLSLSIYFGCLVDETRETKSEFDMSTIAIGAK